jgi:hypothetical protein
MELSDEVSTGSGIDCVIIIDSVPAGGGKS